MIVLPSLLTKNSWPWRDLNLFVLFIREADINSQMLRNVRTQHGFLNFLAVCRTEEEKRVKPAQEKVRLQAEWVEFKARLAEKISGGKVTF